MVSWWAALAGGAWEGLCARGFVGSEITLVGKGQPGNELRRTPSGRTQGEEQVQRSTGGDQLARWEGCAQWASGEAVGGKVRDKGTRQLL